jgi:sugar-specific transcriptional regulator TrmB
MIETLLAQLGLQDKEIRVYLMVYQERKMPAARIAELTGIQRSTVYHVAEVV